MEVEQLLGEYLDGGRVAQRRELLQGEEVDVVCAVDDLRDAEDVVRHGLAPPQQRGILHVVDAVADQLGLQTGRDTYSKLAVCSMPTTFVMTVKLSSGTFNHSLKADISCARMSFPGWPNR